MTLDHLDEYQGIDETTVRAWLANLDPAIKPSAIADDILAISELCGETPQALLREINPRMRKGMPSSAARKAHASGVWVAGRGVLGSGGTIVYVSFDPHSEDGLPLAGWDLDEWDEWDVTLAEIASEWSFWPCDEHGNKVRWPTDAEGML